jgi:hypothetical protein
MLDRELTDRRIVEAILRSEKLEVEFEKVPATPGQPDRLKFTIFSTDLTDGRSFIFGEGNAEEIWGVVRARLEEANL